MPRHKSEKWLWTDVESDCPVCTISPRNCRHDEIDPNLLDLRSSFIASFNWLVRNKGGPVMLVPGCPQQYIRWKGGKLKPAKRAMFVDQNGAMNPHFNLESLIHAVNICNDLVKMQNFQWQSIDICSDRNNLRKLYSIANNQRKKRDGPVRIDLERVGKIVMLTRLEPRYKAFDQEGNFGHSFEHEATRPIAGAGFSNRPGDGSFRCIKKVEFGGLKMLVRFEVDAADYSNVSPAFRRQIGFSMANAPLPQLFSNLSTLSYTVASAMVIPNSEGKPTLPVSNLASLVELTTVNSGVTSKKWAQMYFSGTDLLAVGRHKDGLVERVDELTLSEVEERIGGRPVDKLQNMAALLLSLVDFVRNQPETNLFTALWLPGGEDELRIYRRHSNAFTRVAPGPVLQSIKI